MCLLFDSAFIALRSNPLPPCLLGSMRERDRKGKESAHYSKRSGTSEIAELMHSQRSVWCREDAMRTAVKGSAYMTMHMAKKTDDLHRGTKGQCERRL